MNFWEVVLIVLNFSLFSWILLVGRETKKWSISYFDCRFNGFISERSTRK